MPLITLTTDMGLRDYYVSSIKAAIYSQLQDVKVVDITHKIEPWNIIQASFIVKHAFRFFPLGSIHIIGVDTEPTPKKPHIAALFEGHYFIGADNGIFSIIFENKQPEKLVLINIIPEPHFITFPTMDVFVKSACHIARGGILDIIGKNYLAEDLNKAIIGDPVIDTNTNTLVGKIIHIDNYGNAITNIPFQIFKNLAGNKPFSFVNRPAHFRSYKGEYHFKSIGNNYSDTAEGEIIVLKNSLNYVEIAINKGNAVGLLDLEEGQQIKFNFNIKIHDHQNRKNDLSSR